MAALLALIVLLGAASLDDSIAAAQSRSDRPVVILRNGRVLEGRAVWEEGRCIIALVGGGQIDLPEGQVTLAAPHLREAHNRLARRLGRFDTTQRLELCQWCLSTGLLAEARDHLQKLNSRTLEPREQERHAALQRRLRSAVELRASGNQQLVTGAAADGSSAASATSADSAEPPPDPRVERELNHFTSQIQPILLNRCSLGKCHGGRGASYFLQRPLRGGPISPRLSRRNLDSTLQAITRSAHTERDFLKWAEAPHGSSDQGPLAGSDIAADRLRQWVEHLAASEQQRRSAGSGGDGGTTSQASSPSPGSSQPNDPVDEPTPDEQAVSRRFDAHHWAEEADTDVNPFDPDPFNRRFHPDGKPESDRAEPGG